MLGRRGAAVIDADAVAREVTSPGTLGHDAVLEAFGDVVRGPDGSLDRAALARIVFADQDALRRLEAIVHPLVRPAILERIAEVVAARAPAVVIEAIKLVEGGLAELCDEVWLVDCPAESQRERLTGRGMDPADADRRIDAQADIRERLAPMVTRRVDASGELDELQREIDRIWDLLRR
jgi:dephospho-CoA kinase